jgi:hypothetical protein
MNYKYKYDKYNTKGNNLLGGYIFTDKVKNNIINKIDEVIKNKKLMNNSNPSLQEIIFNDVNFIQFQTISDIKYFLIDNYGNLIDYFNSDKDIQIIQKIIDQEKILKDNAIPDLEDPEFNMVIENQIYLGLLYSNQIYIELFDLELLDTLHVFTKTIVRMVLDKIKSV